MNITLELQSRHIFYQVLVDYSHIVSRHLVVIAKTNDSVTVTLLLACSLQTTLLCRGEAARLSVFGVKQVSVIAA